MVVKTSTFTKHIFNYLIKPNFLYHKSSIFVPKFVTEPNENVDLYSEISDFGEKIEAKDRFKFNKTKSKNSVSNRKEHQKKKHLCHFDFLRSTVLLLELLTIKYAI